MNIAPTRLVRWNGKVDEGNLKATTDRILELERESTKPIHLWICSSGGSSAYGLTFHSMMRILKLPLVTIGSGDISSIGLIVWLTGKRRYLAKHTTVFFHENRRVFSDNGQTEDALVSAAKNVGMSTDNYLDIVTKASNGKLTRKKLKELISKEQTLTPEEMMKIGLAHGIL